MRKETLKSLFVIKNRMWNNEKEMTSVLKNHFQNKMSMCELRRRFSFDKLKMEFRNFLLSWNRLFLEMFFFFPKIIYVWKWLFNFFI